MTKQRRKISTEILEPGTWPWKLSLWKTDFPVPQFDLRIFINLFELYSLGDISIYDLAWLALRSYEFQGRNLNSIEVSWLELTMATIDAYLFDNGWEGGEPIEAVNELLAKFTADYANLFPILSHSTIFFPKKFVDLNGLHYEFYGFYLSEGKKKALISCESVRPPRSVREACNALPSTRCQVVELAAIDSWWGLYPIVRFEEFLNVDGVITMVNGDECLLALPISNEARAQHPRFQSPCFRLADLEPIELERQDFELPTAELLWESAWTRSSEHLRYPS